jgi:HEPN domain-containing protein
MKRTHDWLAQAERDLDRADLDLDHAFWEWACFTAQQAAEKAAKALLMHLGYSAWGHAITPMLRGLHEVSVPPEMIELAQSLDAHYVLARYPNGFAEGKPADYYNERQAREAVHAAREIVRFCHHHIAESG